MTDPEFMDRAEALLQTVEVCCDRMNDLDDVDVDNQRVGSMVTLSFPNRSQIIINLQKPLHEVWIAARSGGYHFRWQDGVWEDTKGQGEFFVTLSKDASAQAGLPLNFSR
jgi:CyaY protein